MMETPLRIPSDKTGALALAAGLQQSGESWKSDIAEFIRLFFDETVTGITFTTSGTTGNPKAIFFTREQLLESARQTCSYFGLGSTDKALLCLPARYVAGRMMLVRAFVCGMELYAVRPSSDPLNTHELPEISFAAMTPAQVYSAVFSTKENLQKFSGIKTVIVGGGEISPVLEEKLAGLGNRVYATYGMTETLTHVAVRKAGTPVYHAVSTHTRFETDEEQRLVVNVPYISAGPLVTNDIVRLENSGAFEWIGRYDHIINSGGLKIYPEQLEKKLAAHPLLEGKRFYITSSSDPKFGQTVTLVTGPGTDIGQEELDALNTLLGRNEKIRKSVSVSGFAETATGKVIREKF